MTENPGCQAIVMGASWGGINAYMRIIARLPGTLPVPVLLVQHQHMSAADRLARLLALRTEMPVVTPEDKESIIPGSIYVAPPGYHMLVEPDRRISFSLSAPVHYSRPAIDELFYSAADVYGAGLVAVLLTGANDDGAEGIAYIRRRGGVTVAQQPDNAEAPVMPAAAIATGYVDYVLELDEIGDFLIELAFGARND